MLAAVEAVVMGDACNLAILRQRILATVPDELRVIAEAFGVTKQAIHQREARVVQRLKANNLWGLVQLRVGARRHFFRAQLLACERDALLREMADAGFSVAKLAERRGIKAHTWLYQQIQDAGLSETLHAAQEEKRRDRDLREGEYLKARLEAHGFSVHAAFHGNASQITIAYELLHDLGLVEWLVQMRDKTRTQPTRGVPLVASQPKMRTRHRALKRPHLDTTEGRS